MPCINRVELLGNLGKDPELRSLQDGKQVATLSVATCFRFTNKQGVREERTEWHRVEVFGKPAEYAGNYLKRGNLVYVAGELRRERWTDSEGVERDIWKIVVAAPKHELQSLERRPDQGQGRAAA